MIAKVTTRTELGPSHALPTVRQARIERGMRLGLAQCAQLTLTHDFAWDRDFGSGGASRVAMMQPADHRKGDDLPPIGGLALVEVGGVLVEREVGPGAVIVLEVLPQDAPQVLVSDDDNVVKSTRPGKPGDSTASMEGRAVLARDHRLNLFARGLAANRCRVLLPMREPSPA